MNPEISEYSEIKDIEKVVETFRQLATRLSEDGHHLGELYVRAEKKAARYALLSSTIVESVTSGILVVERTGELILANKAAKSFLSVGKNEEVAGRRLTDVFKDCQELESMVTDDIRTCNNSSRRILAVVTKDGRRRRVGASTSCVRSSPSKADALIIIFTELGKGDRSQEEADDYEVERQSYLRGVLDSYDLLRNVGLDADRLRAIEKSGTFSLSDLSHLSRGIRYAWDVMIAFALSHIAVDSSYELVAVNELIESITAKAKFAGVNLHQNLCADIAKVRTVRRIVETGLELLLVGCICESHEGVAISTHTKQQGGRAFVRVVIDERNSTKPLVSIGHSLREFVKGGNLRREAGLMLLSSLARENHRILVEKKGTLFSFSIDFLLPISNEAGPTAQKGDVSDRGSDQG